MKPGGDNNTSNSNSISNVNTNTSSSTNSSPSVSHIRSDINESPQLHRYTGAEQQRNSFSNTLNTLKDSRLMPIASCDTIHASNTSSSSNSSTTVNNEETKTLNEEQKRTNATTTDSKGQLTVAKKASSTENLTSKTRSLANNPEPSSTSSTPMNKRTSNMIENVLSSVMKVNVSDGIINPAAKKATNEMHKMSVTSMPLGTSFLIPNADNKTFSKVTIVTNGAEVSACGDGEDDEDENETHEEDYNSDEDSNMRNKFRQVRKVVHNKENKSTSSLNGSISSAASRLGVCY
jgi:hypothetical protein